MDFGATSAHHRAAVVRAGPFHGWGPARFGSSGAGGAHFPYLPREQDAKLPASAGVTDVTGCPRTTHSFLDAAQCKNPNAAESEGRLGQLEAAMIFTDRIMIYSPKGDGTYLVK